MSRISKTKIVNTKTESYDSSPSGGGHQGLAGILEDMHRRLNDGFSPHVHADFIGRALNVAAIVAVTDIKGDITYVNSKFCEISGYSESELIGFNHRMLKTGKHPTAFFRTMYRQIARGEAWHGEICNRRKDGSLYWVDTTIVPHMAENGKPDSYTSIRFDITARKEMEEELRTSKERLNYIANHDALTGLPNRRFFQNFIEGLVTQCSRSGENFSLALIDIDTFKEINDSFGHLTGDELLRIVGERLSRMTDDRMLAQSARSCDFGHLGEHVGNGLVVVDDRPCEERRSAPIRERRYEPWRFEWGSDRLLEPEFFGHRVRDRQSGDGTTGIGGSA